jgi:H+-translocating NAD(P) transhydrogenase subunit alpha
MIVGILKEHEPEKRVALIPDAIVQLAKTNTQLLVERGAGVQAFFSDADYQQAGAVICEADKIYREAAILLMVNPPEADRIARLKNGQVIIGAFNPLSNPDLVALLRDAGITAFSLDAIPRITRAQAMDVLSSMATVAGYRAVLEAAMALPKFFPMFMSAAGTIRPAKVMVLGAGVAGLQAIATARKLGAVVEAFDVRSAVREEVQSLGAKFIEVEGAREEASAGGYAVEQTEEFKQRQSDLIHQRALQSDVIICTAQIPGRRAPLLIKKETVGKMNPGSVIVDLAASSGGNCELTQNNKTIVEHQVTIIGNSFYPATMPVDASRMYGKNLMNFLELMLDKEGNLNLNFDDEIVAGACITHQNQIVNERVKAAFSNS